MSKFLYFADGHCQGINSCNRLGNYFKDWLLKFDELLQIAKDNKCETIIDGGDLLEVKNPAYTVLDEIADRVEKAGIPVYSLFGNHAMNCGHLANSQNTGLSHLQKRSKLFHYLTEIKNKYVTIIGIDYSFGIEDKLKETSILLEFEKNDSWKIVVVHALVTPKPFFKGTSYITPKEIRTDADLVLCSHYHAPFQQKIGDVEFLNIGAFGRLPISEAKIEPSVLLLDTDKKSYEIIKLKSAKSGSEVFDLTKYEELKSSEKDISEFIEAMKNVNLQNMNIHSQIALIAKENKIDTNVVEYILAKLSEVE